MTNDKDNSKMQNGSNEPEVQNELSQVAGSQQKNLLILGIVLGAFIFIFYNMFFVTDTKDQKKEEPKLNESQIVKPNADPNLPPIPELPLVVEKPIIETDAPIMEKPEIPKLLPVAESKPVELPTPVPPIGVESDGILTGNEQHDQKKEARRKSAMMLISGTKPKLEEDVLKADLVKISSLEYVLGRGKIIDAVLESAINTDFGGEVRAIISKDVFSESGKIILIPKGSRVFGSYSTGIKGAYGRVEIIWDRIDLQSGYRLNLSAYAVDNLLRRGIHGRVDNKYFEKMSNSVLTSTFNVVTAKVIDKIVKPANSSEAATKGKESATSIQNAAVAAFSDPLKTSANICSAITSNISDTTSNSYKQAVDGCNAIAVNNGTEDVKRTQAMTLATQIASSVLTTTTKDATPSKSQTAATEGFKNITDTLKGIIEQNNDNLQPTITIDQGKLVQIYVTRDYAFPKAAIFKKRS